MLAPGQKAHFDVFGFVIFRQAFNREEIEKITSEAEIIWEERRKKNPSQDDGLSSHEFVELRPTLTNLLVDDRIHGTIEGLLGPNFIFAGSEGQVTCHRYHGWHTDRPGDEEELSYHRIKVMIYLDPLDKNNGCLRVIPGSHRLPLHGQIEPEERHQHEDHVKPASPGRIGPAFLWNVVQVILYFLIIVSGMACSMGQKDGAISR
jgi:ectoine hydroxylase-related dioxygenase (phytanoyl-CoA dioxygenase family)